MREKCEARTKEWDVGNDGKSRITGLQWGMVGFGRYPYSKKMKFGDSDSYSGSIGIIHAVSPDFRMPRENAL